ncbi:MAG TPA: glutamate-1-semialdehyde 2,1-aminomutase [Phycisphaerae bacterium]
MKLAKSEAAYKEALRLMPGGVNSPVRAFKAVGGTPVFFARGAGAILTDIDGNDYIDYVGSWGPLILGHADERIEAAIGKASAKGTSFGAPTELETHLAELVISRMPSIEMVRFVNSGTEATMSALRLARAATGRDKIIKCAGCYHGHVDSMLVKAGSGALTLGVPSSPGVPKAVAADTLVVPYNDLDAVEAAFRAEPKRIAAMIVEPIAGNMGLVPPQPGYLEGLRAACDRHGALLIFDEVITGFRASSGGAQVLYGVRPDLTCLGKIVGGGLPVGAYGGGADLMTQMSPAGSVYQAGTLSGNPLAMAAGIAMLEALADAEVYSLLELRSRRLADGLIDAAKEAGVATYHTRAASMLCMFFTDGPVIDDAGAARCDTQAYARFFHEMLTRGIYLAPSQFETLFVSVAHTDEHIDRTVAAARLALARVAEERARTNHGR